MTKIILNGDAFDVLPESNCYDLIAQLHYQKKRIAIEINGNIIAKSSFTTSTLKTGDKVEIICAIGGG